jgi:hypothetical protein
MKLASFLFAVLGLLTYKVNAQSSRSLSGVVKDSAGAAIEAATVKVAISKDTISSITDKSGRYQFKNIKADKFTITISSTGYITYTESYEFKKDQNVLELQPIVLKVQMHELKEVVVKSVIAPVTVKEDTVEYDARAYKIREGDLVEDLLKQLPGIDVDKDGNVKAEGKGMTKLRVNGQDFFTNDVTTFIKQLPANILSKVQVIDDYGDEANFTGVKTGEPQKMLNLVTKPGMNKGTFGNTSATAGTNSVKSISANGNLWRDSKQISANGNISHADNNSLVSNNSSVSASYRNNWGKKFSFNAGYTYNDYRSKSSSSTYNETLYPSGSLYTTSDHASENTAKGHNLHMGLNYNKDRKNYLTLQAALGCHEAAGNYTSASAQKGVVFQDLRNMGSSNQRSPNVSGSAYYSHRFQKAGRFVSITFNVGANTNNNDEGLSDFTRYYDLTSGLPVKDSTLARIVHSKNSSTNTSFSVSYNEPINKNNFVDVSYNYSSNVSQTSLITDVTKAPGISELVDSLSNIYRNIFANHRLGINYRHTTKFINYTAGIQFQPTTIDGEYVGRKESIHHTSFNFSPAASMQLHISKTSSLNMGYGGQSSSPNITQLQPVTDTRNLQNIVIGNPDLKPSFTHRLNVSYNKHSPEKGTMINLSLNGSTIKDQVVTDVRLINDTLARTFRQETHYKNVNGNYNVGGNYNFSQPLFKNSLNIDIAGRLGYSRSISFANNILSASQNTNLSQSVGLRLSLEWLAINGDIQYANNRQNYTVGINRNISIETWNYNIGTQIFILKNRIRAGIDATKQVNKGYYSNVANNPLYINANASMSFLKKDRANVSIRVNDFLNQGNVPTRMVSGNSITDSRTNYITRYVIVAFTIRLNKFGRDE